MFKTFKIRPAFMMTALITAGMLLSSAMGHASTIYSFSLVPTSGGGNFSGTMLVTFQTAIPTTGSFTASQGGTVGQYTTNITALTITMSDGATFSLAQENGSASFGFYNDSLNNVSYDDNDYPIEPIIGIGGTHFDFSTNGNYSGPTYSGGNVIFNGVAVAATPEPSGLLLLGTGLLSLLGVAQMVGRKLGVYQASAI